MNTVRQIQRVIPAIIPESESHLKTALRAVQFAHELHIDVVDGQFVPMSSWPYTPEGRPQTQTSQLSAHTVEVDLMVTDPLTAAEAWVEAGAQMIVFHVETVDVVAIKNFIATYDTVSVGVSALNDTPLDTLLPYLAVADYVQVMGIATIGAQGAAFDERVLERIAHILTQYPTLTISVDGSVNATTLERLRDAGADRFVVGSAIMGAAEPEQSFNTLQALARPQS